MPYVDYLLTTDTDLTKGMISEGFPRELTPNLDLGKDNRTWNKTQLQALKLILCNIVDHGREDNGVFLYSRDKTRNIPRRFNPQQISYSSLLAVIDKLIEAGILEGEKAKPRTKGNNPKKLSEFRVTRQILDFAISLGINHLNVRTEAQFHVRLRDRVTDQNLEFDYEEYTRHTEKLMVQYCAYLNQQDFFIGEDYIEDKAQKTNWYGQKGKPIHLFRNYRNWYAYEQFRDDIDQLWTEARNPNFFFGGRGGGFWQGAKKDDRRVILINGKKAAKADFPCCHINLCYRKETNRWHQTETFKDLKEEGREEEDAYYIHNVPRDIVKQMVLIMFNVKGRSAVSRTFNKWLRGENEDDSKNATPQQVREWQFCGLNNIQLMDLLELKHNKIKDYFYKGKIAGQIIQWEEANFIHYLAWEFITTYDFPVYTVYDELICPEENVAMVRDFMFTSGSCDVSDKYSLFTKIKNL